jgi:hypothetical protein
MFFRVDCYEVSSGFQNSGFKYFKSVHRGDTRSRLEWRLYISPNENVVSITQVEYIPERVSWESIDLSQVKITADDALRIAEKNGGSKVRDDLSDNCAILASFEAGGKYKDWLVTYFSNGSWFDINIDGRTGEYKIIR